MARARGANAVMAMAFETTYGTSPGSGYKKVPFVSAALGEQQNLIESDLLGYGREPQPPARDVINNDGDVVVPLDLRNFGTWLKLVFGNPTTTQGVAATGAVTFSAQPANNATITIGGAPWTFVSSGVTGDKSLIGATLQETLANAVIGLNKSATVALTGQTYALDLTGTIILITSKTIGTGGNSVTLAASTSPASNGTVSGATLSGGSASGPYNHVFTSGALSLPSASIEVGLPEVPSYGMNFGAMADKVSIQLQRSGLLNATLSLIAQGETRAATSGAGTPTETALERFSQFSGAIRRDGVPLGNVVSGTFTYANGLDKVEIIRSDGRIAGADPAMLAVTGQIGVRFADTTLLDLAVGGTAVELVFEWSISASKLLRFVAHAVYLPRPKLPISGPGGVQATFDWQAAKHSTLGKTCTATLINDVASY
ncbi:phage tail tube protein [Blastochloris viridis]|uniref:Site-specific recombinase XerD n=1 Tax=Blastochloris viridis TaxID=1079 RepID=A0A0H5BG15_BLAVI|nr:phage tail tube protein [Blastochloris viridis]ALK09003.1 hypothetical protein BVIR_1214 [Blastochloris viridis]BAS01138.1 site-specific recombinase XerD [Blastochloris viridis]CUU41664.1 hypothetical protein BVIRIDIS_06570 [Blastochloris viridis]